MNNSSKLFLRGKITWKENSLFVIVYIVVSVSEKILNSEINLKNNGAIVWQSLNFTAMGLMPRVEEEF